MTQAGRGDSAKVDAREIEQRVERLLAALAQPPQVRARAEELVRVLMALYGEALARVVGLLDSATVGRLAEDDLLASLLILHDLHPRTAAERIERALEQVLSSSGSAVGSIELIGIEENTVARIRLGGAEAGCRSSLAALRRAVEQAVLDAAPEIVEVRVEQAPAREPVLLQIGFGPPAEAADAGLPRRGEA